MLQPTFPLPTEPCHASSGLSGVLPLGGAVDRAWSLALTQLFARGDAHLAGPVAAAMFASIELGREVVPMATELSLASKTTAEL